MLRWPALTVTLTLAVLAAGPVDAATKNKNKGADTGEVSYRWTDEKGVVHYGDHVPPEYAKSERAVLNQDGVVIRRLEAEKTPEQRALDAARDRDIDARRQHDRFLLTTYTSVKDIEALRDQRLEQIVGQSAAARQYVDSLNTRLTGLQAKAQLYRPYSSDENARRMPDDLAADLVRTVSELRAQNNILLTKQQERDSVALQFQADMDRFVELQSSIAKH
ncbi:MAG TPA: DUF4124 domain-containing protein [Steroidobacteraceae bacterium]|nr:DUF4124 domain-containing protein [Steroidobacteraceae bacterium]HNS26522.1 DUF4124 domain-containing protein [Steroidobacteraceae bacterium]